MAIQTRHKRMTDFSSASISDLVFLLLIFFILLSTMVSPNAIKLMLPSSSSRTMAKQTTTVYIDDQYRFYVEETPVSEDQLATYIEDNLAGQQAASVVLRADKTVPVQYIVTVCDAVLAVNQRLGTEHKVILATSAKDE